MSISYIYIERENHYEPLLNFSIFRKIMVLCVPHPKLCQNRLCIQCHTRPKELGAGLTWSDLPALKCRCTWLKIIILKKVIYILSTLEKTWIDPFRYCKQECKVHISDERRAMKLHIHPVIVNQYKGFTTKEFKKYFHH